MVVSDVTKWVLFCVLTEARTQAHLPLQPGLPPVPPGPLTGQYIGDAPVAYADDVLLGGSRDQVVAAAIHDVDAVSEPFHEWDINHASGPSVLDCPDGFALTGDNTCVFLEFRRPQESCPYGTFRDRTGSSCVQVDSVPPDRTCPAGFDYFMRGCIRKTQTPPLLTCPAGYSQLENLCYSVSSVPPQLRCPHGTSLITMQSDDSSVPTLARCQTEIVTKPEYSCPEHARLLTDPIGAVVSANADDLHQWTLSPDIPRCLSTHEMPPVASCVAGFSLVSSAHLNPENPPDSLESLQTDMDRLDSLLCAKLLEHQGELVCESGSTLVWPQVIDAAGMSAVEADPYRGMRCRPLVSKGSPSTADPLFSGAASIPVWPEAVVVDELGRSKDITRSMRHNITLLSENIELFSDEGGISLTPSAIKQLLAENDSSDRGKTLRRTPRSLSAITNWFKFGGKTQADLLIPQGQYPRIQFTKQFCQNQDLHALKWVDPPAVYSSVMPDVTSALTQLLQATDSYFRSVKDKQNPVVATLHSVPVCREVQTMPPRLTCSAPATVKCQSLLPVTVEEIGESGDDDITDGDTTPEPEQRVRRLLAATSLSKRAAKRAGLREASRLEAGQTSASLPTSSTPQLRGGSDSVASEGFLDTLLTAQSESRALHDLADYSYVLANQEEVAIRSCIEQEGGQAVCMMTETLTPATPFCASADQILTLRPMRGVDNNGIRALSGSQNFQVAVCQLRGDLEPELECPFGVGTIGHASGRCDVLLASPLSATCPEGYTKTTHEKPNVVTDNYKKLFSGKKGMLVGPFVPEDTFTGANGVCELIEYADYQITCPHGYRREKAKNTAAACVTEKAIMPSIICPPGFLATTETPSLSLDDPRGCVKQVVVAPTIISYPQEKTPPQGAQVTGGALATACVLTKEHNLSCGVERKYHGMTELSKQRLFGETFKAKLDRKSRAQSERFE